jgi:hypothetical protein
MLLAHRYHDRTHFIFELLQNAEDALARRGTWAGPRAVNFVLSKSALAVSHYGIPFSEPNVRGICGIGESTKDLTSIGHFGIGFKSVYAFTDRPEMHSGDEHFAVDSFVWPEAVDPIDLRPDETRFILPLRPGDSSAQDEIAKGFQHLGPRTLLFLREIEEIEWSVEEGASGFYLRDKAISIGPNARKIRVFGQDRGASDVTEETWLIFSREVDSPEGEKAGYVEIAFALTEEDGKPADVQPVDDSVLVVYFPTIVPTNTGFVIQGPYRTTPSRDNIPRDDEWNQKLVSETATLLVESLGTLRELGLLSASALETLPLDRGKFGEGSLLSPIFETTRAALLDQALIPRFDGGYVRAGDAKLARGQDLRELITPSQLSDLMKADHPLGWVTEAVTLDRTPELRQYMMRELNISEMRPEDIVPLLTKEFLEKQSDSWMVSLYEFLNEQSAVMRFGRLRDVPVIRLESGAHVRPVEQGQRQAFLPGTTRTGFPTVRRAVCETEEARRFLQALGLTEPDPVDDVIWHVLPKYAGDTAFEVSDEEYEADIRRILTAFGTDSKGQRERLVTALRASDFIKAVDAGELDTGPGSTTWLAKPGEVYLATQRLKELFTGVAGVLLVDDSCSCLRGEEVRDLLEACGASRSLQPVQVASRFSWSELLEMRTRAGWAGSTSLDTIADFTLRGLDPLLDLLPTLDAERASRTAALLWEALGEMVDRRGAGAFLGTYNWFYFQTRSCVFDAVFVKRLNETAWVPDRNGAIHPPSSVVFEETGWKLNPFLLSKLQFKPPILEALAREAGIEPGLLELLKKLGVTSEAQLKTRLGIKEDQAGEGEHGTESVGDALKKLLGDAPKPTPPVPDPAGPEPTGTGGGGSGASGSGGGAQTTHGGSGSPAAGSNGGGKASGTGNGQHAHKAGSSGARPFYSYVGTHPDDEEPDPDGLDQQARLALEEKAIALIIAQEPELRRMPTNNEGFDLVELGPDGTTVRWIEVKAMTGDLKSRPVGVSRSQFKSAQEHGDNYWLYVVERAGLPEEARLVRIQDPSGKARTFTFDHGWLQIAQINQPDHLDQQEQSDEE